MEQEIFSMIGVIERVSQKEKSYGIKIGETWLNGFGKCPIKQGEAATVEFTKGEYQGKPTMNVKKIIPEKFVEKKVAVPEVVVASDEELIERSKKLAALLVSDFTGSNFPDEDMRSFLISVRESMFRELALDRRTKMIALLKK